jgi:hypothetical protein
MEVGLDVTYQHHYHEITRLNRFSLKFTGLRGHPDGTLGARKPLRFCHVRVESRIVVTLHNVLDFTPYRRILRTKEELKDFVKLQMC